MVHVASVWVPFTSESKEAIASYPEILKELRLGLQTVGRKLAVYVNRRKRVRQEGERREIFLRYLGEVAHAVATIKDFGERPRKDLYGRLVDVAKRKTVVADAQLNEDGKPPRDTAEEFGENVLIVNPDETPGEAALPEPAA
jgi:DNA topoisomerase-6 subunit B